MDATGHLAVGVRHQVRVSITSDSLVDDLAAVSAELERRGAVLWMAGWHDGYAPAGCVYRRDPVGQMIELLDRGVAQRLSVRRAAGAHGGQVEGRHSMDEGELSMDTMPIAVSGTRGAIVATRNLRRQHGQPRRRHLRSALRMVGAG